jgi:hypothetical protein
MQRFLHTASLALSFSFIAFSGTTAEANEEAVIDLGKPIESVVIADAAYGRGPNNEAWIYAVIKGDPAVLNIVELPTGRRVGSFPLPESVISWGVDVTPNGTVYIGSQRGGRLYRYVPGAGQVENLGRMLAGESHIWQLDHDEQGRIYGGTYPGGRLFQYDPASGKVRDYGRLAEDSDYVRGVAVGDGVVYAGLGSRKARIIAVDIASGERREIELPPGAGGATFGYLLRYSEGHLFAWLYDVGSYAFNTASGKWVTEMPLPSQAGPDGRVYFLRDQELRTWDPDSQAESATGFPSRLLGPRSWGWFESLAPEMPGQSLVTIDQRGGGFIYNPETATGHHFRTDVEGQSQEIRSMHRGPDGRIYIGGYLSPGLMAAHDPERQETLPLAGIEQVESFGSHDGELYIGVYSRAIIFRYDPALPWDFGRNPRRLMQLSPHEQDRPFAIASAGERVAIGTVPVTGRLGGALTIYDPQTDNYRVHRGIVKDQSIVSLAYHQPTGLLIGGTSISGGLGIEPAAREGKLFLWDIEREEKVWSAVPIAGEVAVTGLTVDQDGMVWGVAGQHLFRFDPAARKIVRSKDLFPEAPTLRPNTIWMNGQLNFHHDGMLYARVRGRIIRLDPETWDHELLIDRANYFAQADDGDIYFSRGHRLLRLPLTEAASRE